MPVPSQDVVNAIESGITRVTRRLEIFESDAVTPWTPTGAEEDTFRMVSGNVSIDGTRDERRTMDVVLDNSDNKLRPDPRDGFWYDKVLRPWRGVRYQAVNAPPRVLIIDAPDQQTALRLKALFTSLGMTNTDINLNATTLSDLSGYKIVAGDSGAGTLTKAALFKDGFDHGFDVFTKGLGNGIGEIPYVASETAFTNAAPLRINPAVQDSPLAGGWVGEAEGSGSGMAIVSLDATAVGVATSLNNSVTHWTASLKDTATARWFDYKPVDVGTQARAMIHKAFRWLWRYTPYVEWEMALGDFLPDAMDTQSFPGTMSISARDFTKKCLKSKLERNMSFATGTSVNTLITALAANAGIRKIRLNANSDALLGSRIDAARTTDRWSIMKEAANSLACDLFFDSDGWLTTAPYADPTLGSPIASFATGKNLADYKRKTSDSRIYNHVIVTGESDATDGTGLSYFGEAKNTHPQSPTNIERLGDISYFYTSSFFTSDAQCQAYADMLLSQVAFEQYEISFSSLVYPWLDASTVIDFLEPERLEFDPTRFLMDSLTIPLGLEAMAGSGKRVLFIESD